MHQFRLATKSILVVSFAICEVVPFKFRKRRLLMQRTPMMLWGAWEKTNGVNELNCDVMAFWFSNMTACQLRTCWKEWVSNLQQQQSLLPILHFFPFSKIKLKLQDSCFDTVMEIQCKLQMMLDTPTEQDFQGVMAGVQRMVYGCSTLRGLWHYLWGHVMVQCFAWIP